MQIYKKNRFLEKLVRERQAALPDVDGYRLLSVDVSCENLLGEFVYHLSLDYSLDRSCTEHRIVARFFAQLAHFFTARITQFPTKIC